MSEMGERRAKAALSSGCKPTRQPLQPEAIGAVMEVTKWLKPSISVSRIGDGNASERRAILEKDRGYESPGRNKGERVVASKMSIPEGRAFNWRAKAA